MIFFASVINEWPLTKKYIKSNQQVIKASYLNQFFDANKTSKVIKTRSSHQRCSMKNKKFILKISQIHRKKIYADVPFW